MILKQRDRTKRAHTQTLESDNRIKFLNVISPLLLRLNACKIKNEVSLLNEYIIYKEWYESE